MSTTTPKPLFDPLLVPITATTVYTVPTNTVTIIKHLSVCNVTTTPKTFTFYLGENGWSAVTSIQRFIKLIAGGDSVPIFAAVNATLEEGATIQVKSSTASALSVHGGGNEVVG